MGVSLSFPIGKWAFDVARLRRCCCNCRPPPRVSTPMLCGHLSNHPGLPPSIPDYVDAEATRCGRFPNHATVCTISTRATKPHDSSSPPTPMIHAGFLNDSRVDFLQTYRHVYKRILIIFRTPLSQKMSRKLQVVG